MIKQFLILLTITMLLLSGIGLLQVFATQKEAIIPDSASQGITDASGVCKLLNIASVKEGNNERDSAEYYYRLAGESAKRIKYHEGFFEYTSMYARFLYTQLRYRDALEISKQQLALSKQLGRINKTANAYNNMGCQYHALGELTLAANSFIKALKLSETNNDPVNLQKFYSNLSSIFIDLKDKKKSFYYGKKGYDIAVKLGDSTLIGNRLVNLALSEMLNENYENALVHLNQLIEIGTKTGNTFQLMDAYLNIAELYTLKKDYSESIKWYKKTAGLLTAGVPADYEIYTFFGLANTHFKLGHYEKANHFFEKNLANAEQCLSKNELKQLFLLGADLKEKLNDPLAALKLRKKYESLSDSILNAGTRQNIHELEVKYQSSVKEQALAHQKLQLVNQQYSLQQKDKQIVWYILIIIILICSVLITYLIFRHRQKAVAAMKKTDILNARLNGEEKERARQAKELHDGVGGVLSAARMHISMLNIEYQRQDYKETFEKTISLLDTASREVRNISHNLAPEIVLHQGLEKAISAYCARISNRDLFAEYYEMGKLPKLKPEYELLIYRIIQECVNNIIRHARASKAIVQTSFDDQYNLLELTIEDDGIGYDPVHIKNGGTGISNLRSRIEALNGKIEIFSKIGQGTSVIIELATTGLSDRTLARNTESENLLT